MPKCDKELSKAVGKRIAAQRKRMGLTQEEVADMAGLSHQFFSRAERGASGLTAESMKRICTVLHISADYLLSGGSEKQKETHELLSGLPEDQYDAMIEIIRQVLAFSDWNSPGK